jgi:uncharacterized protein (UPF0335 family)
MAAPGANPREVYAEVKGNSFDVKAIKSVIRLPRADENKRKEEVVVLVTYLHGFGIVEAEAT